MAFRLYFARISGIGLGSLIRRMTMVLLPSGIGQTIAVWFLVMGLVKALTVGAVEES